MERPLPNSYWVLPGRFLAGEYPVNGGRRNAEERLAGLLAAGVDLFIDLTEPGECLPYDELLPGSVYYLRKPIPDHDVPREPEHMRDIQDEIARALTAGRRLYLHCRAGIGRTGTTVGCYLVEQGSGGDDALVELNRLWQQSARAASWPEVPQTAEQHDYVRRWVARGGAAAPLAGGPAAGREDAAAAALRPLRARFVGALLGLAVGDALAAATQYRRSGSFTPVGDLIGGGPFELPRGAWSDDAAMALCLAESFAELDRFDSHDQVERYQRWRRTGHWSATGQCLGITASTARALAQAGWRRQAFAGPHDPKLVDPEPLSRVAPAVMHGFADPAAAVEQAVDAARTTCQSPLVLDACRALGAMMYAALRGEARATVLAPAPALFGNRPLKPEVAQIMLHTPAAALPAHAANSGVLGALEAARWAFAQGSSFRDGALRAVNCGGNADVIGAVYGQLAGAHYGAAGIPPAWLSVLARRDEITTLADRLLATALVRLGGA
ncbi:MAG: ADP-ribosylglycohydrolase family protein [Gammaproteobacteria bacterium]|nr:ADP-ribosylglycohydrolase family protein [Gammaproteobacteria bacterium]